MSAESTPEIDRDALAERAGGLTVVSVLEKGGNEDEQADETTVHSTRSRDMATLLEHEGFTPTDFHAIILNDRGDPEVAVLQPGDGEALGGRPPADLPAEVPHYMFAGQGQYSHIIAIDGRISSTPNESMELLSEWGVEVDTYPEA